MEIFKKWKKKKKPRYLLKEQVYQISALTNIFGLCRLPQRFQTDRQTHCQILAQNKDYLSTKLNSYNGDAFY